MRLHVMLEFRIVYAWAVKVYCLYMRLRYNDISAATPTAYTRVTTLKLGTVLDEFIKICHTKSCRPTRYETSSKSAHIESDFCIESVLQTDRQKQCGLPNRSVTKGISPQCPHPHHTPPLSS